MWYSVSYIRMLHISKRFCRNDQFFKRKYNFTSVNFHLKSFADVLLLRVKNIDDTEYRGITTFQRTGNQSNFPSKGVNRKESNYGFIDGYIFVNFADKFKRKSRCRDAYRTSECASCSSCFWVQWRAVLDHQDQMFPMEMQFKWVLFWLYLCIRKCFHSLIFLYFRVIFAKKFKNLII